MLVRQIPVLVLGAVLGFAASAQEAAAPQDCIDLMRLDRTDVVDDQTILFYMNNRDVLLNSLPGKCPGIRSEGRFMYRVTMNRLCSSDLITVIYQAGFGLTEGPSCRLGKFEPVSQEFAKKIAAPKRAGPEAETP